MTLLLATLAFAKPHFGVMLGVESVINDPFVATTGGRTGFTAALAPYLEVGASLAVYPIIGNAGCTTPRWKPLACDLRDRYGISPDISYLTGELEGEVRVLPFRARLGKFETDFGFSAGIGAVTTEDDLVALQAENEPDAVATADQVHPAVVGGLLADVRIQHFGVRFRVHDILYLETVNSTVLESKHNLLTATEAVFWF